MSYAITGIKKGLGPGEALPLRREVDEWWSSNDQNDLNQRSLFIYALNEFQNMSANDQMSYFAIAGSSDTPLESLLSKTDTSRYPWSTPRSLGYKNSQEFLVLYSWYSAISAVA
jgi:hypothetical protein